MGKVICLASMPRSALVAHRTFLTPKENSMAYNRLFGKRLRGSPKFTTSAYMQSKKRVRLLYPTCADYDYVSRTQWEEWQKNGIFMPTGTRVWVDGKEVTG